MLPTLSILKLSAQSTHQTLGVNEIGDYGGEEYKVPDRTAGFQDAA